MNIAMQNRELGVCACTHQYEQALMLHCLNMEVDESLERIRRGRDRRT